MAAVSLNVGFEHSVHPALVAGAGRAKPFQHLGVNAQGNLLLGLLKQGGRRQAAGGFKKRVIQRQIIRIRLGGAGDFLVRRIFQALPVRL